MTRTGQNSPFCSVFRLPPHGGTFKYPRIPAHFGQKLRFGGVCAGENVSQLRRFTSNLRGFGVFLRIFTFCTFAPLYLYIFLKNKDKYINKAVKKGKSACAVLYISILLPTRFFLPCAVFSRSFRAVGVLGNSCSYVKKWLINKQLRGCAGNSPYGC
jgi:hypothetical protein